MNLAALEQRGKQMLTVVVEIAQRGGRAPTLDQFRDQHGIVAAQDVLQMLCATGWLRSEVYGLNYRVLEVTRGEHKGLRTAEDPRRSNPWLIMDAAGTKKLT